MIKIIVSDNRTQAIQMGAIFKRGNFFNGEENAWYMDEDNPNLSKFVISKDNEKEWDKILKTRNTIKIAEGLGTLGMPILENQKISMLRILSDRNSSNLRIRYDDLYQYSSDFAIAYGPDVIKKLSERLAGISDFQLAVDNGNFTDEERALLKYIFE